MAFRLLGETGFAAASLSPTLSPLSPFPAHFHPPPVPAGDFHGGRPSVPWRGGGGGDHKAPLAAPCPGRRAGVSLRFPGGLRRILTPRAELRPPAASRASRGQETRRHGEPQKRTQLSRGRRPAPMLSNYFPYTTSFFTNNATVCSFGGKHKVIIRFQWDFHAGPDVAGKHLVLCPKWHYFKCVCKAVGSAVTLRAACRFWPPAHGT